MKAWYAACLTHGEMMRFPTAVVLLCGCAAQPSDLTAPPEPEGALAQAATVTCPAPTVVSTAGANEVGVVGDPGAPAGIFDASTVYPAGAPGGALAYSAVLSQHDIRTRIALSSTGGALWSYVAEVNHPELAFIASPDPAECPGGLCGGWLISEVSSLIYDPTDPNPGARWKLYAHRYLAEATDRLHYALGAITVQVAPAPQGPWTAPRKLFGWPNPSGYSLAGAQVDVSKLAGLADCVALTEPGALWLPDRIDVALGCVYLAAGAPRIRVVQLRSTDHGASWASAGRLLDVGDADCLPGAAPGASVNAANLFVGPDGAEYLAATASDGNGYHGCAIYRVDDPWTGHVERTPTGAPRVLRAIVADVGGFSGACAHSAGTGYTLAAAALGQARPFRLYRAGRVAP